MRRLEKNPLRIFDCKSQQCIGVTADSPLLFGSLCDECRDHFDLFGKYMADFGIDVEVNKRLVRGLDYYTKTVFEITSDDLGAQKAFIAGGRYDNLVEEMGGRQRQASVLPWASRGSPCSSPTEGPRGHRSASLPV